MRPQQSYVVALRISRVSSPSLTNWSTALTSLVAVPMLEVALIVAIAASVGSESLPSVAYAGVLVAMGSSVIAGAISEVSRDRALGVLQDALTNRSFNSSYWLAKVTVPIVLGVSFALAAIGAVFMVDPVHSVDLATRALLLVPVVSLLSGAVAVGASTSSVALRDPFLISNVLTALLPITAGVIVPLTLYPDWLAAAARALPLTACVEAMWSPHLGAADVMALVGRDLLVCGGWLALGLSTARHVIKLLRDGRREDVW